MRTRRQGARGLKMCPYTHTHTNRSFMGTLYISEKIFTLLLPNISDVLVLHTPYTYTEQSHYHTSLFVMDFLVCFSEREEVVVEGREAFCCCSKSTCSFSHTSLPPVSLSMLSHNAPLHPAHNQPHSTGTP